MVGALVCAALLLAACGKAAAPLQTPTARSDRAQPSATRLAPTTGSDELPARDPVDLARRYLGVADAPERVALPAPAPGQRMTFRLVELPPDPETPPKRRVIAAKLAAATEHAYFFFEGDSAPDEDELADATRAFEDEVWPRVTAAFGTPAMPGIDGDPRIVLLHADLGGAVSGYVSGSDAYPRTVAPLSNQREAVYLDRSLPLGSSIYTTVLAHELQHLIHQRHDPDEDVWVQEGASELAAGLVDGGTIFYRDFLDHPDTQLTGWSFGLSESAAHYGASSLFISYLMEQTGGSPRALLAQPADGAEGIEAFLRTTEEQRSFKELVVDWAVANQLDLPNGPYSHQNKDIPAAATASVDGSGSGAGAVQPFGVDYLELNAQDFPQAPIFTFEGDATVPAVAARRDALGTFWWSGSGDGIDATLTRELDLTGVERATLTYRLWFDIERWFDFAYISVSSDGGETWTPLAGRHTSNDDPLGIAYGPAYTGRSGQRDRPRWVNERIDLSGYAGQRLLLRFEYVTDDGASGPGLALDDIAVPEIGFFDDGEADASGWRRAGFRRVEAPQPQRFALRLITFESPPRVQPVELDARNDARIDLAGLGDSYNSAVIVVVNLTDGTSVPGRYRYNVRTTGAGS